MEISNPHGYKDSQVRNTKILKEDQVNVVLVRMRIKTIVVKEFNLMIT